MSQEAEDDTDFDALFEEALKDPEVKQAYEDHHRLRELMHTTYNRGKWDGAKLIAKTQTISKILLGEKVI